MDRIVRIGAGSATFKDSLLAMPQLLRESEDGAGGLDYIVFDYLAEAVMPTLARTAKAGGPGYHAAFVNEEVMPHLATLMARGIRIIANAGGLDPQGCADMLRARAAEMGLQPRIAVVEGDNLTDRLDEFVTADTRDMFDGTPVRAALDEADAVLSLVAYTGAFPVAAALDAGADIVIAGRIVDSAATLGALIHEFGWKPEDFDRLSAGTLAGHLIECSTQVTGGTFTDWQDVPDWENIGFPIAECRADGSIVITKPDGTGGLVSRGTVAEQLLYETSDPQRYIVPDVVCDFSQVKIEDIGPQRVRVSGALGHGRTPTLKCSVTYDRGWRATAVMPVIGIDAAAKAERMAQSFIKRTEGLLRDRQLPPWTQAHHEVMGGGDGSGGMAVFRVVLDHPSMEAAALAAREQSSIITSMSVGTTAPLSAGVRPVQFIRGFLCPREAVSIRVTLDGKELDHASTAGGSDAHREVAAPAAPPVPDDARETLSVPLIRLAWARSGDKGDLFNVGVIARRPHYLPYIHAALDPERVGAHYGRLVGSGPPLAVERYSLPGFDALNLVIAASLHGGMMASPRLDPAAKGMAQLLLHFPVPVSPDIAAEVGAQVGDATARAAVAEPA